MAHLDLQDFVFSSSIDFNVEPELAPAGMPGSRVKVASLGDISQFFRNASDQLVHRSSQDLWALRKEADGYYIERLFDDNGNPLKE